MRACTFVMFFLISGCSILISKPIVNNVSPKRYQPKKRNTYPEEYDPTSLYLIVTLRKNVIINYRVIRYPSGISRLSYDNKYIKNDKLYLKFEPIPPDSQCWLAEMPERSNGTFKLVGKLSTSFIPDSPPNQIEIDFVIENGYIKESIYNPNIGLYYAGPNEIFYGMEGTLKSKKFTDKVWKFIFPYADGRYTIKAAMYEKYIPDQIEILFIVKDRKVIKSRYSPDLKLYLDTTKYINGQKVGILKSKIHNNQIWEFHFPERDGEFVVNARRQN